MKTLNPFYRDHNHFLRKKYSSGTPCSKTKRIISWRRKRIRKRWGQERKKRGKVVQNFLSLNNGVDVYRTFDGCTWRNSPFFSLWVYDRRQFAFYHSDSQLFWNASFCLAVRCHLQSWHFFSFNNSYDFHLFHLVLHKLEQSQVLSSSSFNLEDVSPDSGKTPVKKRKVPWTLGQVFYLSLI